MQIDAPPSKKCLEILKPKSVIKTQAKKNRKKRHQKKKNLKELSKKEEDKKKDADKKDFSTEIFHMFTNTVPDLFNYKDYERRKLLSKMTPEDLEYKEVEDVYDDIQPPFLSIKEIIDLRRTHGDLSVGDFVMVFPNPDSPLMKNRGINFREAVEIYDTNIKVITDDIMVSNDELRSQYVAFKKAFLSLKPYVHEDDLFEQKKKMEKMKKNDKKEEKKENEDSKPLEPNGKPNGKPQEPNIQLDQKSSSRDKLIPAPPPKHRNSKEEARAIKEQYETVSSEQETRDPRDLSYWLEQDVSVEGKLAQVVKSYCHGGFMTEEPLPDSEDVDRICPAMPPKDFLTLVRNIIMTKLVRNAKMHTRSFVSSDGKSIVVVVKADEKMIRREAEASFMDKQVELGACDLFSLEPVDSKGRPLRVKPYIRKPQYPEGAEDMPDIEKEDRESGTSSVSSRAQSMFQKLMKMTDVQLQKLLEKKQQAVDEILAKVAKTQNMDYSNYYDLLEDDTSVSREAWETYYLYLAYIHELLTKVEKEVNFKKKDAKRELEQKEEEERKEAEGKKDDPNNPTKKKKKKEPVVKGKKDDYVLPEMKENEFFLYKLVFLKALGDSNEVSFANYRNSCLDFFGWESEEKRHRLKTIWSLLGTDPIPPFMKYKDVGGDIWRSYEKNERGQRSKFLQMERLKMVHKILSKHLNVVRLVKGKFLESIFPLHDFYQMDGDFNAPLFKKLYEKKILKERPDTGGEKRVRQYFMMMADEAEKTDFDTDGSSLADDIAFNCSRPWQINVESMRNYFGEKIAMYFNFLSFYTLFLFPMAFLGIIAQGVQDQSSLMVSNGMKMAFSVLIIIWSTIFIELWKRKESLFAVQFGQLDTEQAEAERASFKGQFIRSIQNDDINVKHFSPLRKTIRVCVSYFISIFILIVVVTTVILILFFKNYLSECGCVDMSNTFIAAIPSIINAIQIQVFNFIYSNVGLALNEYENHKLISQYENSLVFKIFAFSFVNTFNSLVILSFMSSLFPTLEICQNSTTGVSDCFDAVATQMQTLFITAFCKNFIEIAMPYINLYLKTSKKKHNEHKEDYPFLLIDEQIEVQLDKTPYAANLEVDGTLEDYMELVIQFGFLCLFSVTFPISFMMAFVTNIAEIQVDKLKIVRFKRRPVPENAKNLGTWLLIIDFLSFLSIFFNAALIAYTSTCIYLQDSQTKNKVFVLFVFLFLSIKYIIKILIPDVPEKTRLVEMRHNFIKTRVELGISGQRGNKMRQAKVNVEIHGLEVSPLKDDDASPQNRGDPESIDIERKPDEVEMAPLSN